MKPPKNFNKMSIGEQENWLVGKLMKIEIEMKELRRMLAKVRGGARLQVETDERPDEILLKSVG